MPGETLPPAPGDSGNYSGQSRLYTLIEAIFLVAIVFLSVLKPWGMRKPKFSVNRKVVVGVAGSTAVILVAFLVMNSLTLQRYRKMEIANSELAAIEDGTYYGEATIGGFTYKVEVKVLHHWIENIKIIQNRKNAYARYAEWVIPRIIEAQNANVDAITGATTTSKCLMKAVENALTNRIPAK